MLSQVVSIIKHKVPSAEAIIYLGINPVEAGRHFLLVLTANEEKETAQGLGRCIEESCQPVAKIIALVHHKSFVLNTGKEDNLFVRKALNCPVIYLSGDMMLPIFHSVLSVNSRELNLLWERWHKQGKDFLNGAEFYLQSGAVNAALFCLQQCTECMLVAIIRAVLGYRINNHNLSTLLRITLMFTGDLASVFNLDNIEDMELFNLLKHAYVNVRYKDQFEAEEGSVKDLLVEVRKLVAITENIYQTQFLTGSL